CSSASHVQVGAHGVPAYGTQHAIWHDELPWKGLAFVDDAAAATTAIQALRAAVGNERSLTETCLNGGHRMDDVHHGRATARHRVINVLGLNVQVFSDEQGIGAIIPMGKDAVDITGSQAGVQHGSP